MRETVVIVAASIAVIAIAAVALVVALRSRGAPAETADGGIRVPLRAAFGSVKGAGMMGGSHNNFNPLLMLYDDRIEYRVIKRTTAPYASIAGVDAVTGWGRASVVLSFTDSNFLFTGNTGGRPALTKVLRFLRDKGCPLSDAARAIADAPQA